MTPEPVQNRGRFPGFGSKYRYSGRTHYETKKTTIDRPAPNFERSLSGRRLTSKSMDSKSRINPSPDLTRVGFYLLPFFSSGRGQESGISREQRSQQKAHDVPSAGAHTRHGGETQKVEKGQIGEGNFQRGGPKWKKNFFCLVWESRMSLCVLMRYRTQRDGETSSHSSISSTEGDYNPQRKEEGEVKINHCMMILSLRFFFSEFFFYIILWI